jgi:hypothetical protein
MTAWLEQQRPDTERSDAMLDTPAVYIQDRAAWEELPASR